MTDNVDPNKFDPRTISLFPITIGNKTVLLDPRVTDTGDMLVPLRPTMSVRMRARVDRSFGIIQWDFLSVTPSGTEAPVDSGFLLVNKYPPLGQGNVDFTVTPLAQLAANATLQNVAAIDFDGRIRPTSWMSTVDNTPPASRMLPRGSITDSANFTVRWKAFDPQLGPDSPPPGDLEDFTLYVSKNGGDFTTWLLDTTVTAAVYAGRPGDRYAFKSTARDTCGNSEPVPATTQDTVVVVGVAGKPPLPRLALEGARPNPALGTIRAWFTLPSREPATLELIDVAGRRVVRREVGEMGPGRHVLALKSSPWLRSGLYFVRLTQADGALTARVVLIR